MIFLSKKNPKPPPPPHYIQPPTPACITWDSDQEMYIHLEDSDMVHASDNTI